MKTKLPDGISNIEDAKKLFRDLFNNDEHYHPDDDAHDIIDHKGNFIFTEKEANTLNTLVQSTYKIKDFDPCGFLLNLMESRYIKDKLKKQ